MQQKLQTILFFTFLICAQISIINSLKIKSKINSRTQISSNATNTTTPAPTEPAPKQNTTAPAPKSKKDSPKDLEKKRNQKKNNHHHHQKLESDVNSFTPIDQSDPETNNHRKQYNVHHEVPRNLTSLNNKVRDRFATAHKRLDELDDLRKENEERKVIEKLPSKPDGVTSIGILNFNLRHISKQSVNFNITSVADFEIAYNKARYFKTSSVKVNQKRYKIKQIGDNFWYGAIVGSGGIGLYSHGDYLLVVTHDFDMSLMDFARYFQHLKHQFDNNKDNLRVVYIKDKTKERTDLMKDRLRTDKHLYDKNH